MKRYFHELSDDEIKELLDSHITIGEIIEQYEPPCWCNHPCALEGQCGCWSLMDLFDKRHKISREYCKTCNEYKAK